MSRWFDRTRTQRRNLDALRLFDDPRSPRRSLSHASGTSRREPRPPARAVTGSVAVLILMLFAPTLLTGCLLSRTQVARLPERHSVETEQLLILSDVRLSLHHPLVTDLQQLQQRITHELQLPDADRQVVVYLFGNEDAYRRYLHAAYPGLPPRRAYFVGTSDELAVFTFWGDRIREDLRHEFTHGLLHAALRNVPLWLDEGLAEYFEVVSEDSERPVHAEYVDELLAAARRGWKPDLHRLEELHDVAEMHRRDYAEAWAWVWYFLNSSDEQRSQLLDYLLELRENAHPPAFSRRLDGERARWTNRLLSFLLQEAQRQRLARRS